MVFFTDKQYSFLKRTNDLLEKTKKDINKYAKQRYTLFNYTLDNNPNYEEWEKALKDFEKSL